jgi:hypothetical protein
MKRITLLMICATALLLTAASFDRLPSPDTALACCSGADRQRCSDLCGGRAYCDLGACLCACPA